MAGKRIAKAKLGDVFEVNLEDDYKAYFQFIALDITQLNSEVIRVFKKRYCQDENPPLEEVVQDEVEFHAHVIIKFGIKLNIWQKVGNVQLESNVSISKFRDSRDYGFPEIEYSERWFVWESGEKTNYIGRLSKAEAEYEIGIVVTPLDIVDRLQTGEYQFVYPKVLVPES